MARRQSIGEVRGHGLMVGVDFVSDRHTRAGHPGVRDRVVQAAFTRGVLVLACGESAVRLSPPLIVSRPQIDTALEILDASVAAATSDPPRDDPDI